MAATTSVFPVPGRIIGRARPSGTVAARMDWRMLQSVGADGSSRGRPIPGGYPASTRISRVDIALGRSRRDLHDHRRSVPAPHRESASVRIPSRRSRQEARGWLRHHFGPIPGVSHPGRRPHARSYEPGVSRVLPRGCASTHAPGASGPGRGFPDDVARPCDRSASASGPRMAGRTDDTRRRIGRTER